MSWGCAVWFLILMGCCLNFVINFEILKTKIGKKKSHFMFSSRFMLFSTFLENKFRGGGQKMRGGGPKKFFFI